MDDRLSPLDLADPPEQWEAIERRIPLHGVPSGPSPSHRIAVAAVALVVAVGGTLYAVRAFSPDRHSAIPARPDTLIYTDPSGWTATYPATWTATPITVTADGLATGVTFSPRQRPMGPVANVSLTITHPIHVFEGLVLPRWSHRLPLRLQDFKPAPGSGSGLGLNFREGSTLYFARVTLAGATSQQISDLESILASITFASATAAPSMLSYTDPFSGWTVSYPASWRIRATGITPVRLGGVVILSSRPRSEGHHVTVSILGPLGKNPTPADRTLRWPVDFPLSLSRFLGVPGPFEVSSRTFRRGRNFYEVSAQLLGATPQDVADVKAIIASITFPAG